MSVGEIVQIIGPVIDVKFANNEMPNIYDALFIEDKDLYLEVEQLIGDNIARTIAMGVTDGLCRGLKVKNTHKPISVPTGKKTLGRILNVVGKAIDNKPELEGERAPIHRKPPKFTDLKVSDELLITGIKVIDLLCPFAKGGKIGLFGGAGVGN